VRTLLSGVVAWIALNDIALHQLRALSGTGGGTALSLKVHFLLLALREQNVYNGLRGAAPM
jgi:hypothetical protein